MERLAINWLKDQYAIAARHEAVAESEADEVARARAFSRRHTLADVAYEFFGINLIHPEHDE